MMLNRLEKKLMEEGYDSFSLEEKNLFIKNVASKLNMPINGVTEEYILKHHKDIKKYQLKSTCDLGILGGFVASNGHHYRTNRDDQINMLGKKDQLNFNPSIESVYWKTEDVGYIDHTREEWLGIHFEAFDFIEDRIYRYNALKELVDAAVTHDEVNAVTWETVLPNTEE